MSLNLPKSVAWFDWEEWTFVHRSLFSNDVEQQVTGIQLVSLWKVRGKVPHSAESTAQLVEVSSLFDKFFQESW